MGSKNCIITSNLRTKNEGGFYAQQNKIEDAGIGVYFDLKGKPKVMLLDKWGSPEHNMWSLFLSVQAIRGLERWGGVEFLDGLFTGFQALPDYTTTAIRYFEGCSSQEHVEERKKNLQRELHPDSGGNEEEFKEMMRQYQEIKQK